VQAQKPASPGKNPLPVQFVLLDGEDAVAVAVPASGMIGLSAHVVGCGELLLSLGDLPRCASAADSMISLRSANSGSSGSAGNRQADEDSPDTSAKEH